MFTRFDNLTENSMWISRSCACKRVFAHSWVRLHASAYICTRVSESVRVYVFLRASAWVYARGVRLRMCVQFRSRMLACVYACVSASECFCACVSLSARVCVRLCVLACVCVRLRLCVRTRMVGVQRVHVRACVCVRFFARVRNNDLL